MAVTVICSCGARYDLKDEFLGRVVECPGCHTKTLATGQPQIPQAQGQTKVQDPIFDRDRFLLRQKHLAIAEKYYVWDEEGNTLLYVERPAYYLLHFLAVICGVFAGIIVLISLGGMAVKVNNPILWAFVVLASLFALFAVTIILYKKSHVYFYRDDSKKELVLKVTQDNKIQICNAYYTVMDKDDIVLAKLRKNYLYNLLRRRWLGFSPEGNLLFIAREDSLILSLLRRILGSFFGILRMNFEIIDNNGNSLGEFDRKLTILDRYVLDMSQDIYRKIDRRVCLALGVMLDTGERR